MPHQDSTIYLRFPGQCDQKVLHPAKVLTVKSSRTFSVLPQDAALTLKDGVELLIYFEFGGKFVQQSARIGPPAGDDPEAGTEMETIGEWVSAESRQSYRISTVMSNLTATFGGEKNCPLQDISISGFALIASAIYPVGEIVDAELTHDGKTFTGRVTVQSVREAINGQYRYGVNCVKDKPSATSLAKGVQLISMNEQRSKLSRLSRTA